MKPLITRAQLIQGTPMGGNIDPDEYSFVIKDTEDLLIEPILGTALFQRIKSDNDSGAISGIYKTILDNYIVPILKHSVAAEYIVESAYNVRNGGIFKHLPTNAEAVSKNEVDFLTERQRTKAQVHIDRLERFLCDKGNELPEYKEQSNDYDIKPNTDTNYLGGWHI